MIWYKDINNDDIVVSTRIRLARNLLNYPFPNRMTNKQVKDACEEIKESIIGSNSTLRNEFTMYNMEELDAKEKQLMYEKHLISSDMLKRPFASVMITKDENMSIMLMEEDHIRLQVIMGGMKLKEAYETATKVDDVIDESVKYAFSKDFGYLTSCPTNTGTGMRASVMMHLPALTMTDNIQRIISSASNLGIAIRGLYGEGSKAYGNLYQISNQVTLGLCENEIIEKVTNIVKQIIELEKDARNKIYKNNKYGLEDRIWRSLGILKNARLMTSKEAKTLISDVIMGKNMGIITDTDKNLIELLVYTEPAFIEADSKEKLSPEERDRQRADFLRKELNK